MATYKKSEVAWFFSKEDPRWELIRQLVEYKKFKDAAAQLGGLEARQEQVFPRVPCPPEFEVEAAPLKGQAGLDRKSTRLNSSHT